MGDLDLEAIEREARDELESANGYAPWDQERWLGAPPWSPSDPALQAWEAAHGHDVRLRCYPECGCQLEHVPYNRTILALIERERGEQGTGRA